MFSNQQLFLVFLQYTPPYGCFGGGRCVAIHNKCYQDCPTCPDVCSNTTETREECVKSHDYYFWSAQMEYKVKCEDNFFGSVSIAEAQFSGLLLGNFFVGYIADKFGRRLMLLIALLLGIPILVLSGAVVSRSAFYMLRFLLGICIAGTMSVGWAYCSEMISPKHRFKLRTFTSWTNGRILMTLLTLAASRWRLASYYNAAASLLTLCAVAFLPESPLWLKRKGYYERESYARRHLAWMNGLDYESEKGEKKKGVQAPLVNMWEMFFEDPELRKNFLVLAVMWFCAGLSMYCIDLNGEDMTKNLWLGQFMSAILASVIRVIVGFADDRFLWLGRRTVYILSMGICIIASAGLLIENVSNMKGSTIYFVTYLIAYNSISVSWEPNYLGAAELMPTEVRAKSTAGLNIISRVSNLIAARVVGRLKGKWEPGILITVLASNIFSFVVTFTWLKETKNVNLEKVTRSRRSKRQLPPTKPASAESAGEVSKSPDTKTPSITQGSKEDTKKDSKTEVVDKKEPGEEKKPDGGVLLSAEGTKFNKLALAPLQAPKLGSKEEAPKSVGSKEGTAQTVGSKEGASKPAESKETGSKQGSKEEPKTGSKEEQKQESKTGSKPEAKEAVAKEEPKKASKDEAKPGENAPQEEGDEENP